MRDLLLALLKLEGPKRCWKMRGVGWVELRLVRLGVCGVRACVMWRADDVVSRRPIQAVFVVVSGWLVVLFVLARNDFFLLATREKKRNVRNEVGGLSRDGRGRTKKKKKISREKTSFSLSRGKGKGSSWPRVSRRR